MVCDDLLNQKINIQKIMKTLVAWKWQPLLAKPKVQNQGPHWPGIRWHKIQCHWNSHVATTFTFNTKGVERQTTRHDS
jgi:hypothetical protein